MPSASARAVPSGNTSTSVPVKSVSRAWTESTASAPAARSPPRLPSTAASGRPARPSAAPPRADPWACASSRHWRRSAPDPSGRRRTDPAARPPAHRVEPAVARRRHRASGAAQVVRRRMRARANGHSCSSRQRFSPITNRRIGAVVHRRAVAALQPVVEPADHRFVGLEATVGAEVDLADLRGRAGRARVGPRAHHQPLVAPRGLVGGVLAQSREVAQGAGQQRVVPAGEVEGRHLEAIVAGSRCRPAPRTRRRRGATASGGSLARSVPGRTR